MSFSVGDVIADKYRIESFIGEGAFAQVYLATHLKLNEPRALKILRKDSPGVGTSDFARYQERFQLEARLGAQLERAGHTHTIRVYDFEQFGDMLVLVMEYAAGGSLADRIERARREDAPIPIDECVRIATDIADGLAPIHALDVVHRDLKPSNVLFDGKGHAKVADLGLAQVANLSADRDVLGSLAPRHPGTPAYMSPEQEETTTYLKPPSDIYALGLILFEMLTRRNYKGLRPGTRAVTLRPDTPQWLDEVTARMLAQDPNARPWDGVGGAEALREKAEEERKREEAEERAKREAEESTSREREEQARREAEKRQRKVNELVLTLASGVTLELVRVAAGEFLMGSAKLKDSEASDNELPQHKVYLDEYLISKYPVTVLQFAAFVKATGYQTTAEQQGRGWISPVVGMEKEIRGASWQHPRGPQSDVHKKANHPVTLVSWYDAVAFCEWASKTTRRRVHLPTEAEWEKAARGTDGRIYPWGNPGLIKKYFDFMAYDIDLVARGRCNFDMNVKDTTPVGTYSPRGDSPYGCADMAGNVWEWTSSLNKPYPYQRDDGREDASGRDLRFLRVLRGGSFCHADKCAVRCAFRGCSVPDYCIDAYGLRVCVSPIDL